MRLTDHIDGWLRRPVDELQAEMLDGAFGSPVPGQRLSWTFGAIADTIDEGHPVVTVSATQGRLRLECSLVTDPTCLEAFAVALKERLS